MWLVSYNPPTKILGALLVFESKPFWKVLFWEILPSFKPEVSKELGRYYHLQQCCWFSLTKLNCFRAAWAQHKLEAPAHPEHFVSHKSEFAALWWENFCRGLFWSVCRCLRTTNRQPPTSQVLFTLLSTTTTTTTHNLFHVFINKHLPNAITAFNSKTQAPSPTNSNPK